MQLTLRQHCHLQCSRNVQWSYKKKKDKNKNLTTLSINLWFYIKMYLSLSWGACGMQGYSLNMPGNAFRDWCCPKCRDLNFSKCCNKSQDLSDGIRSSLLLLLTWKGLKKLSRLEVHMCSISSRSHTVSPPDPAASVLCGDMASASKKHLPFLPCCCGPDSDQLGSVWPDSRQCACRWPGDKHKERSNYTVSRNRVGGGRVAFALLFRDTIWPGFHLRWPLEVRNEEAMICFTARSCAQGLTPEISVGWRSAETVPLLVEPAEAWGLTEWLWM